MQQQARNFALLIAENAGRLLSRESGGLMGISTYLVLGKNPVACDGSK
jgi:hypothetical protein